MHKHAYLMIWLFFSGIGSLFLAFTYWVGYDFFWLMRADKTGFSLFILFVFLVGWVSAVRDIWWLDNLYSERQEKASLPAEYATRDSVLSYIIFTLPALGFLGTVVGVYIITENFDNALRSVTEIARLIEHMKQIVGGIKTAVITTIIGLAASSFLALLHAIFYIGYVKNSELAEKVNNGGPHENTSQN